MSTPYLYLGKTFIVVNGAQAPVRNHSEENVLAHLVAPALRNSHPQISCRVGKKPPYNISIATPSSAVAQQIIADEYWRYDPTQPHRPCSPNLVLRPLFSHATCNIDTPRRPQRPGEPTATANTPLTVPPNNEWVAPSHGRRMLHPSSLSTPPAIPVHATVQSAYPTPASSTAATPNITSNPTPPLPALPNPQAPASSSSQNPTTNALPAPAQQTPTPIHPAPPASAPSSAPLSLLPHPPHPQPPAISPSQIPATTASTSAPSAPQQQHPNPPLPAPPVPASSSAPPTPLPKYTPPNTSPPSAPATPAFADAPALSPDSSNGSPTPAAASSVSGVKRKKVEEDGAADGTLADGVEGEDETAGGPTAKRTKLDNGLDCATASGSAEGDVRTDDAETAV
ncbi:hypothetical protein HDV00_012487 [Rhizophlyctis rosea]|nr:hypothetical protein HDV00_012487 [Rhizophlyctis rosea]